MKTRLVSHTTGTPGKVPAPADIALGELSINHADGKLFIKLKDGSVIDIFGQMIPVAQIIGLTNRLAVLEAFMDGFEFLEGEADGNGDVVFNYAKSYSANPKVFPSVAWSSTTHGATYSIRAESKTGCTIRAMKTKTTTVLLGGNIDPDEAVTAGTKVYLIVRK